MITDVSNREVTLVLRAVGVGVTNKRRLVVVVQVVVRQSNVVGSVGNVQKAILIGLAANWVEGFQAMTPPVENLGQKVFKG